MSSLQEFSQNFGGKPVPEALTRLLAFQDEKGYERYSQGFGLLYDNKSGLRHGWSDDPAFLEKLMPFAQANGSGSFYALWQYDDNVELPELPVVIFGDEGGEYVVSENLLGLLQLLTVDAEPGVYEGVGFGRDEDDEYWEPSEFAGDYREWLQTHYQLEEITDGDEIVDAAQAKYQESFDNWKKQFFGE